MILNLDKSVVIKKKDRDERTLSVLDSGWVNEALPEAEPVRWKRARSHEQLLRRQSREVMQIKQLRGRDRLYTYD